MLVVGDCCAGGWRLARSERKSGGGVRKESAKSETEQDGKEKIDVNQRVRRTMKGKRKRITSKRNKEGRFRSRTRCRTRRKRRRGGKTNIKKMRRRRKRNYKYK